MFRIPCIDVISIRDNPEWLQRSAEYYSRIWSPPISVYLDCVGASLATPNPLPRWYLALRGEKIVGSYGLITNDMNSRQDLWPWLAALHVAPEERGKGLGGALLKHGVAEAAKLGFPTVYLITDHISYYERYGWEFLATGYGMEGTPHRVYQQSLIRDYISPSS